MKFTRYLALPGLTLLVGCAPGVAPATPVGHATLVLTPRVQAGGLSTQALLTPYTKSDIIHMLVRVFKLVNGSEQVALAGGNPVVLDLPQANLADQVVLSSLDFDTAYRVRGYAYSDAGTASLICDESTSYIDVTVAQDDRPDFTYLPVQLATRYFVGVGSSSVSIVGGGLSHTGTMSIGYAVSSVENRADMTIMAGSPAGLGWVTGIDRASEPVEPTRRTTAL